MPAFVQTAADNGITGAANEQGQHEPAGPQRGSPATLRAIAQGHVGLAGLARHVTRRPKPLCVLEGSLQFRPWRMLWRSGSKVEAKYWSEWQDLNLVPNEDALTQVSDNS